MSPTVIVTTKLPKLTKAQRRLLLGLAREESHWKYPHRKERLPARALAGLGYTVSERHNGCHRVRLTEAGWNRAQTFQRRLEREFEAKSARSISLGIGPWPEVLRPQPLTPWFQDGTLLGR